MAHLKNVRKINNSISSRVPEEMDSQLKANAIRECLASETRLGISCPFIEQMDKTTLVRPAETDD